MAGIRTEAMLSLARALEAAAPRLAGRVFLRPQANHGLMFPSVEIDPAAFRYEAAHAREAYDPDPNTVVMHVGSYEGPVQLRLMYANEGERAMLEDELVNAFLGTPLHPGALFTIVDRIPEFGPFLCTFDLEDGDWREELAFTDADPKHSSTLTVTASIPALVARGDALRIREIRLHLAGAPAADEEIVIGDA